MIVLLQKLFPAKPEAEKAEAREETNLLKLQQLYEAESDAEEIVAVLAAVAYIRSQRAGQLGAALLTGPGPYRTSR